MGVARTAPITEAPGHILKFRIGAFGFRNALQFQRHAADRTTAGALRRICACIGQV